MRKKTKGDREPVEITDFAIDYLGIMENIEKEYKMSQGSLDKKARHSSYMSTGLLMTDLIMGGGILPGGWYTFAGKEQCAKSTHLMQIVGASINSEVPIINYDDYEGSSDPVYIESMFDGRVKVKNIFGLKDEKDNWVIKPRVRYYSPTTAEDFFDSGAELLRRLPDKLYLKGKWYYAFEDTKTNRSTVDGKHNKVLSSKYGKLIVPTAHTGMQVLFLLDSYPAMYPEKLDEGKGQGMAALARMFAENIPKVRSKMRRKAATIIGANQIRDRPMTMFGNPEYEPGGNAIKFASDCRIQQTPRSNHYGKGPFEEEASVTVEDGKDTYRYIHMKTTKNKMSTPYLEAWTRLWIKDAEGKGRGFDPVYDTYEYLLNTGQVSVAKKARKTGLTITLPNFQNKKPLGWDDFKALILLKKDDLKEYSKYLKLKEVPQIRAECHKQMKDGTGMELYFKQLLNAKSEPEEE